MGRGFSIIGLYRPKFAENVGAVLRAAHCYGVTQVNVAGGRPVWRKSGLNTPKYERHAPLFFVSDLLSYVPEDTKIVCVDLVPGAQPLPAFQHPKRAIYLFGPENGTLSGAQTDRADAVVYVPTRQCMNLAACVNVVLYDRMTKGRADFPMFTVEAA